MVCRWHITSHAIRRYMQRSRPGLGFAAARRELEAFATTAKWVRNLDTGAEEWMTRGPRNGRIRLVINPDMVIAGRPTIVTVIRAPFRARRPGVAARAE